MVEGGASSGSGGSASGDGKDGAGASPDVGAGGTGVCDDALVPRGVVVFAGFAERDEADDDDAPVPDEEGRGAFF